MSDLIRRQDALDALGEKPLAWTEGEYELGLQNQWQSDVDALKALPSAVPERKKGTWIEYPDCLRYEDAYSDDHIVCSECGHVFSICDNCTEEFDFCPHCGADMRGK